MTRTEDHDLVACPFCEVAKGTWCRIKVNGRHSPRTLSLAPELHEERRIAAQGFREGRAQALTEVIAVIETMRESSQAQHVS